MTDNDNKPLTETERALARAYTLRKAVEEAWSAFGWIATEIETGSAPQRLIKYARLNETLLAEVLDKIKYESQIECFVCNEPATYVRDDDIPHCTNCREEDTSGMLWWPIAAALGRRER